MEHSIPTVTPDKGATLAVDDTGPDTTPTQTATPEPVTPDTTATLPTPDPHAEPQPQAPARLQFTANTGDMMEIGTMLFQEAEAILRTGRKRRLKVRIGRRTIAEMPLATGAIGVLVAAMAAVALSRLTVEVE